MSEEEKIAALMESLRETRRNLELAKANGELSEEEYERISELLVRVEVNTPPPAPKRAP